MATWVVGDVHGCYKEFKQLLSNENIKKEDKIILIGDIVDRGPDVPKMIRWAMRNISKTGRYQMIMGNHEDTIIQEYGRFLRRYENKCFNDKDGKLIPFNDLSISCLDCHYHFERYMEDAGYETITSIQPIIKWFRKLPLYKKVEVVDKDGNPKKYVIAHGWWGERMCRDDILWWRDIYEYNGRLDNNDYNGEDGEILIHGHTPTIFIRESVDKDVNEVLFREHSINIDCGCVYKDQDGILAAIRLEDQKVIYVGEQRKITNPYF